MSTSRVDSKKRIVLPDGRPGDVYDIQEQGTGHYLLIRLVKPEPVLRLSRAACLEAMERSPLTPALPWERLRNLTREP